MLELMVKCLETLDLAGLVLRLISSSIMQVAADQLMVELRTLGRSMWLCRDQAGPQSASSQSCSWAQHP